MCLPASLCDRSRNHIPFRQFCPGHEAQSPDLARLVRNSTTGINSNPARTYVASCKEVESPESTKNPRFPGVLDRFLTEKPAQDHREILLILDTWSMGLAGSTAFIRLRFGEQFQTASPS